MSDNASPTKLFLDPVACDGIGMCAHLAPALIELDRWGFPLVSTGPLDTRDARSAKRAIRGCPRRALRLVSVAPN